MKEKANRKNNEDVTKSGEFVSSFFSWDTPEEQRKKVKKLENVTKKKEKNEN